jgi:hypothetical protein
VVGDHLLYRSQVALEGENAPVAFLLVEGVHDFFILFEYFPLWKAGVRIDEATLTALDDGMMFPVSEVGAAVGAPVRVAVTVQCRGI